MHADAEGGRHAVEAPLLAMEDKTSPRATVRSRLAQRHCIGQILCACSASVCPAASSSELSEWLSPFLLSALGGSSHDPHVDGGSSGDHNGLLHSRHEIEQLVEYGVSLASSPDARRRGLDEARRHARSLDCEIGGGSRTVRTALEFDVRRGNRYDARTREALLRFCEILDLPPRVVLEEERALSKKLSVEGDAADDEDDEESNAATRKGQRDRNRSMSRWLKIGGATVVGGVAVGVSGGLLAPALLPALGSVGLGGLTAGLSSSAATVAVGSVFGAAGAGIGANAMANRTGALTEFLFEKCMVVEGPDSKYTSSSGSISVSDASPVLDVEIDFGENAGVAGAMVVWEFWTSQTTTALVPARLRFGVLMRDSDTIQAIDSRDGDSISQETPERTERTERTRLMRRLSRKDSAKRTVLDWVYPEEEMDAGGVDSKGRSATRRHTGALTVAAGYGFAFRWHLLPGCHPVNVRYRYAIVPPGCDLPSFIMDASDLEHAGSNVPRSIRTQGMTVALFVPGLLQPDSAACVPGVIADQFSVPGGAVGALDAVGVDSFAVRWETALLAQLSKAIVDIVRKVAMTSAAQTGARMILPALVGALTIPISLVSTIRMAVDNVWANVLNRARLAGPILVDHMALLGRRPVVLAGYSAGATMIFSALEELASREMYGVVHDVFLMGAPIANDAKRWAEVRKVVSGRLVNAFLPGDWYLEVMQRTTSVGGDTFTRVAGTSAVHISNDGIENIDLSELPEDLRISNHSDFASKSSRIFAELGLGNVEYRRPRFGTCSSPKLEMLELSTDVDVEAFGIPESPVCSPGQRHGDVFPKNETVSRSEKRRSRSAEPPEAPAYPEPPESPEVVVFTNRRRRQSHSEPPPVSREPLVD